MPVFKASPGIVPKTSYDIYLLGRWPQTRKPNIAVAPIKMNTYSFLAFSSFLIHPNLPEEPSGCADGHTPRVAQTRPSAVGAERQFLTDLSS